MLVQSGAVGEIPAGKYELCCLVRRVIELREGVEDVGLVGVIIIRRENYLIHSFDDA